MDEPLNYNVLVDMMKELLVRDILKIEGPSKRSWIPEYLILSGKEGLSAFIHILHYTESIYDTGKECLVKLCDSAFFDLTYFYEPFNELAWTYAREISFKSCNHISEYDEAALGLSKNTRLQRLIFSNHNDYLPFTKYIMNRINVANLEYFEGFPWILTRNPHKKFNIKTIKLIIWGDDGLEDFLRSKNIVCTEVLSATLNRMSHFDYPLEVTTQNFKNIHKLEFDGVWQICINNCLEVFKDLLPSVTEIVISTYKTIEPHRNETVDSVERSFKDTLTINYDKKVIINCKLLYHSNRKYRRIPVELLHSKKEVVIKKDVILNITIDYI